MYKVCSFNVGLVVPSPSLGIVLSYKWMNESTPSVFQGRLCADGHGALYTCTSLSVLSGRYTSLDNSKL